VQQVVDYAPAVKRKWHDRHPWLMDSVNTLLFLICFSPMPIVYWHGEHAPLTLDALLKVLRHIETPLSQMLWGIILCLWSIGFWKRPVVHKTACIIGYLLICLNVGIIFFRLIHDSFDRRISENYAGLYLVIAVPVMAPFAIMAVFRGISLFRPRRI
jgi:hypothetical protein